MGQIIDLGKIRFDLVGEYSATESYEYLDVVSFEGSSYAYKKKESFIGTPPSNSSFWQLIADKGDTGDQGLKGDKGDTGDQGLKGDTGDQGLKGDTGDQGLKGDKGDTGDQGLKGDKGDTGDQGLKGDKGDTGTTGVAGVDGSDGSDGAVGIQGAKGDPIEFIGIGTLAGRNSYDTSSKGSCYLDDVNDEFYIKLSASSGDWSNAVSFVDNSTRDIIANLDDLVTRIFDRVSPTQWGFCHVVSEAYTDLVKTTKAVAADDVVVVIEDKSPNDIDLLAGGTDAANKIKLRLDPLTVGVDEAHLTTHFLEVTVPTGGFKGTLIMAYRGGCLVQRDLDVPAGDWKIWSGDSMAVESGFMGAFAAESMSNADIDKILEAFYNLGADSKPLITASSWCLNASNFSKTIDLSNFDFSICTNIHQLMRGAEAKKIILPGNDLSSVTSMYYTFRGCINLTSLDTSNWDLSSVISMTNTFRGCINLTSLDTSNWDLSSVTSMTNTFFGCINLTSLDTSNWDLSSVISMTNTFRGCINLTSLDTSNWDLSSVTSMQYTFYGCSNLTSLIIGSVFDSTACTNFISTFTNCALNQQTVDDILVSIENAGTSNGTLNINGGTSSAPSSVGTTAKTALEGRGWTVTTN